MSQREKEKVLALCEELETYHKTMVKLLERLKFGINNIPSITDEIKELISKVS